MADTAFASLSTSRLVLRRLQPTDVSRLCQYRSDPEVARYQDWTAFSEADARRLVTEQTNHHPDVPGTWFQLAIELRESGELIGDCGLHAIGDRPHQMEIGFTLALEYQGVGYATEAIGGLLEYVFETLGKHRVVAITDARNDAAARLLGRLGMRREGHFLQNVWFKGSWGDEYLYALLRQEWRAADRLTGRR